MSIAGSLGGTGKLTFTMENGNTITVDASMIQYTVDQGGAIDVTTRDSGGWRQFAPGPMEINMHFRCIGEGQWKTSMGRPKRLSVLELLDLLDKELEDRE